MTTEQDTLIPLMHPVKRAVPRIGLTNERQFYRLVAEGRLSVVKVGRRTFVLESEAQRFVASLAGAA